MFNVEQNSIDNHKRFVRRLIENQTVWFIEMSNGSILGFPSNDDGGEFDLEDDEELESLVLPFWSDEAYAKRHLKDNSEDHSIKSFDLEIFINVVLKDLHEKQILVGTNWDAHLCGLEIEPLELAQELEKTKYEFFVQKVIEKNRVWFIVNSDGDLFGCPVLANDSEDGPIIFPFWSDEGYGSIVIEQNFEGHSLQSMQDLNMFIQILKDMHEKKALIGINWNSQLIGSELEPLTLAISLETELSKLSS